MLIMEIQQVGSDTDNLSMNTKPTHSKKVKKKAMCLKTRVTSCSYVVSFHVTTVTVKMNQDFTLIFHFATLRAESRASNFCSTTDHPSFYSILRQHLTKLPRTALSSLCSPGRT